MTQIKVYTMGRVLVDLYANQSGVPLDKTDMFHKYVGGSAANTAIGLGRLGINVGLISRVGNDIFGKYIKDRLTSEGVDIKLLRTDPDYPTALVFAAPFPPNDSEVLHYGYPNAHSQINVEDVKFDPLESERILVVAATSLSTPSSREATLWALKENRNHGGCNVIDVDWRPVFWQKETDAQKYYDAALEFTDVVLANEPELEFAGRSTDPEQAANRILSLGVSEVVAKRGGKGCFHFTRENICKVDPYPVSVVNTLGAGDGFGAAYVYALLQKWPVEHRISFASAAGAIVVSRHSCSEAMPSLEEIEALIHTNRIVGTFTN
ncbi:5-dehydro-2-deoxygluconokinase [Oceanobacillus timonensis]|uniref:5-dehydro-2-deoxygluconokinase n=1 Tax=Oceanobacillus timonensis TaxID=1926285 RepID=UPI0009BA93D1|nr:5-dehydro-2-deoxygluconokinase [Oceanobacillus timonensis]